MAPACYNGGMALTVDTGDEAARRFEQIRFVLCDLDGVVWLRHTAIPGAPQAIERLREAGRRVLFVTNNSMSTIEQQERALAAIGVPAIGDVVTSAQAAAAMVTPGDRVVVCGGEGVVEAVEARRAVALREGEADAVIVGLHHDFDYWRMQAANAAIRAGARFIATNDDATFPTPDGPIPGAGSLVAAVATASGTLPVVAGKPYEPIAELVRQRCGEAFSERSAVMVGDRWSTDGLFAETIGCQFAMVRSGVTEPGQAITDDAGVVARSRVAIDVADLDAVANLLLGR